MQIEEQDQQKLLDLLLASILYVNAKLEPKNPYVRVIGKTMEEQAFDILVNATNALEHLTPLLPEIEEANLSSLPEEINIENKELTDEEPKNVDLDKYL